VDKTGDCKNLETAECRNMQHRILVLAMQKRSLYNFIFLQDCTKAVLTMPHAINTAPLLSFPYNKMFPTFP